MTTSPVLVEKTIDNEWFTANLVRQVDGKLFAHIKYKVWSATAKKVTKEAMDSFDEPLFAFIHDIHHWKYLKALGFEPTGALVTCAHPGKEHLLFGEVMYVKGGFDSYCLKTYEDVGKLVLPLEEIDGYGRLEEIEEKLKEYEQTAWTTKHHFSDGVYTRETFVPKGTILTGYRHKAATVSILSSGIISVISVDPLGYATNKGLLKAPATFVTPAGSKKIGYAHEDVVFINSFPLAGIPEHLHNEENILELEEYIFEKEAQCPVLLQQQ